MGTPSAGPSYRDRAKGNGATGGVKGSAARDISESESPSESCEPAMAGCLEIYMRYDET